MQKKKIQEMDAFQNRKKKFMSEGSICAEYEK